MMHSNFFPFIHFVSTDYIFYMHDPPWLNNEHVPSFGKIWLQATFQS